MSDIGYDLRNDPNTFGQSLVWCIDSGGGYDWTVFYVFRDNATGVLRWWAGQGCSCNSPMDDVYRIEDLSTGTERDLLTDLNAFAQDQDDSDILRSCITAMQSPEFKQIIDIAEGQTK